MKGVIFLVAVTLLLLVHSSQPVYVQDGEFQFPLESVKKLKELLDEDANNLNMKAKPHVAPVCTNPELPKEFQPVCQKEDALHIFNRLKLAIQNVNLCEICVNAACTGCL